MTNSSFKPLNMTDLLTEALDVKLTVTLDLRIERLFSKFHGEQNNREFPSFNGIFLTECTNLDLVKKIRDLLIISTQENKSQIGTLTITSPRIMKVYYEVMPMREELFFIYLKVHQSESINNQYQFIKDLFNRLGKIGTLAETGDLLISQLVKFEPSIGYGIFILDDSRELIYQKFSENCINDQTPKLISLIIDQENWQSISNGISIILQRENNAYKIFEEIVKEFTTLSIQPILYEGSLIGVYFLFSRSVLPNEFRSFLEDFSYQSGIILAGIRDFQLLATRFEQLKKILGSLDSFLFIISSEGSPIFYSPSFRDQMGLLSEDQPLPNILDLLEPGQIEKFHNFLENSTTEFSSEENFFFITNKNERKLISTQVRKIKTENEILCVFKESRDLESLGEDLTIPFSQVFEVTSKLPLPVFFIEEMSFKIILANTYAYELFQYPSDDLTNKNFLELFSSSENINLINTVKTAGLINLESEKYWILEKKDSSLLKSRLIVSTVHFQNKRLLLVTLRDVSNEPSSFEIRESQSEYRANEEYPLFCKLTPDGIIVQVNQAYCDLFGKPLELIIGMPLQGYIFVEDYENVLNHFSRLTPTQPTKKNISRVANTKGDIKYIEWVDTAIYQEGELIEINAVGRDVTQEQKIDLLRKTMEQRYQALVENLPFVISVYHSESAFPLYIGPQILNITGYKPEDFYNDPVKMKELIHPEDWEMFLDNFFTKSDSENMPPFEFRFIKKDGSIGWGEASGSLITLADQTTLRQGFFRDVTGRHYAREKLRYYSNFEKLIIEISLQLMNGREDNLNENLNSVIEKLGKFMQVDRSYVFDFDHRTETMTNTHEWCNEGIQSEIQNLQNVPFSLAPWWIERLNQNLEITYDDINDMPFQSDDQREMFISQGIKSLLVVPIIIEERAEGFIGFDMVNEYTHWEQEALNLLRIVTTMIARTFEKLFVDRPF